MQSGGRNLATLFFAFFLAGWLAWVYTALRVVALSGLHRAVKACYAVDMAADTG